MAEYHIPGRRGPQQHAATVTVADELALDALLGPGRMLNYRGKATEFFPIGALARALNRSVVTIRKWESRVNQDTGLPDPFIPTSTFSVPSKARGGRMRLYSREQIVGLRKIAREEGLLQDTAKAVTKTKFVERSFALFQEMLNQ